MGTLEALQTDLEAHFRSLRASRNETAVGKPLFALEHGLDLASVESLKLSVREAIARRPPSSSVPLPFIVYAAEVGYRYEGEEYWPTFEGLTPGWKEHGDRRWVRQQFRSFASDFGGAQPTGAWAEHFSIISWPITHAVLPTDFQVELVRLLYEYRHHLGSEILSDPDELGLKLASRAAASRTSRRFQRAFSENPSLLGQVATALLSGDESGSLLLPTTLQRIVADLSVEREARRWLTDARASARRLKLRGLSRGPAGQRPPPSTRTPDVATRVLGQPRLSLRWDKPTWHLTLQPPEFTPLLERYDLREALGRSRCLVAGATKLPPLARGQLLYFGLPIPLDTWPGSDSALFRLESGDDKTNELLARECRFPTGPVWLFRLTESGTAVEIRGKRARFGRAYVLLAERELSDLPSWATSSDIDCEGVFAYELRLPEAGGRADISWLTALGIDLTTELELRPIGLEPASWDGEGAGEWLLGEDVLLSLSSTLAVRHCGVIIDGAPPTRLDWPVDKNQPLYLRVTDLGLGDHDIRVIVVPDDTAAPHIEGRLELAIREPLPRVSTGTYREAIVIIASPATPTLEELWDGGATLDILGPPDLRPTVSASLVTGSTHGRVSKAIQSLTFPVSNAAWRSAFERQFRSVKEIARLFDAASSCLVEVSHPEVGSAFISCDRSFVPLRWGAGEDRDGTFIRLHDNVGDLDLRVNRFPFATPTQRVHVSLSDTGEYRCEEGGLFAATGGEYSASIVLPQAVRSLLDIRRAARRPEVPSRPRTPETVHEWMHLAALWHGADIPGDLIAEVARESVVRSFAIAIAGLVGQRWWRDAERAVDDSGASVLHRLDEVLASPGDHAVVRSHLRDLASEFAQLKLSDRIALFSELVLGVLRLPDVVEPGRSVRVAGDDGRSIIAAGTARARLSPGRRPAEGPIERRWFAEFILRLASNPGVVPGWAGEQTRPALEIALQSPIALRAARYLVLRIHHLEGDLESTRPYKGWRWE